MVESSETDDDPSFPEGAWAEFITYYLADGFWILFDDSLDDYEGSDMAGFGRSLARFGDMAKGKLTERLAVDGATTDEISGQIETLIAVSEEAKDLGVQVQNACHGVGPRTSNECQNAWEKMGETLDALYEAFDPWLSDSIEPSPW